MEFIAAIITFIAGYLGATMGAVMNWPDAGATGRNSSERKAIPGVT